MRALGMLQSHAAQRHAMRGAVAKARYRGDRLMQREVLRRWVSALAASRVDRTSRMRQVGAALMHRNIKKGLSTWVLFWQERR